MRDQVLTYLGGENLGGYSLSQQLPYDSSGIAMYVKNTKVVYVGLDQNKQEVFIGLLGSKSIDQEETSVTIFVANDAKTIPSDYASLVTTIRAAQDLYSANGFFRRELSTETEFENDLMITKVELRFYKLI